MTAETYTAEEFERSALMISAATAALGGALGHEVALAGGNIVESVIIGVIGVAVCWILSQAIDYVS